jgi:hypothetical protein
MCYEFDLEDEDIEKLSQDTVIDGLLYVRICHEEKGHNINACLTACLHHNLLDGIWYCLENGALVDFDISSVVVYSVKNNQYELFHWCVKNHFTSINVSRAMGAVWVKDCKQWNGLLNDLGLFYSCYPDCYKYALVFAAQWGAVERVKTLLENGLVDRYATINHLGVKLGLNNFPLVVEKAGL